MVAGKEQVCFDNEGERLGDQNRFGIRPQCTGRRQPCDLGEVSMSRQSTIPSTEFIPTRYSLLSRLQNWGDDESWKDFFDTYWRLFHSLALKAGLTETEAQEVVQEAVISVARNIVKFRRERNLGSFKGWLRNLTRWRIADQLRKRTRLETPGAGWFDRHRRLRLSCLGRQMT